MAISYNKLWKLLIDKKMSKADLRKAAGIAPNTMTRLRRDEEVTLSVLNRICIVLYAAFKKIRNVVTVVAQKKKLILNLPLDVSTVSFEEGFSRDVTNIGHWGCGAVELYLQSGADFEKAKPLIDRAFEEN